jgi:serine/threonine protein kinase
MNAEREAMSATPLRYEIGEALAHGRMASVYRATDREIGREVAVKVLHEQYAADSRHSASRSVESMRHPLEGRMPASCRAPLPPSNQRRVIALPA